MHSSLCVCSPFSLLLLLFHCRRRCAAAAAHCVILVVVCPLSLSSLASSPSSLSLFLPSFPFPMPVVNVPVNFRICSLSVVFPPSRSREPFYATLLPPSYSSSFASSHPIPVLCAGKCSETRDMIIQRKKSASSCKTPGSFSSPFPHYDDGTRVCACVGFLSRDK